VYETEEPAHISLATIHVGTGVVAIGTVLVLSFSEKDKNRLKGEEVF
jgi:hypothetical protein